MSVMCVYKLRINFAESKKKNVKNETSKLFRKRKLQFIH